MAEIIFGLYTFFQTRHVDSDFFQSLPTFPIRNWKLIHAIDLNWSLPKFLPPTSIFYALGFINQKCKIVSPQDLPDLRTLTTIFHTSGFRIRHYRTITKQDYLEFPTPSTTFSTLGVEIQNQHDDPSTNNILILASTFWHYQNINNMNHPTF